MNTRERADDDGKATEVAQFEGSLFAGGAFTVAVTRKGAAVLELLASED